jgi:hypothetical protein
VLEGGCGLGMELGDQGTGVVGAEPSSGGQLSSACSDIKHDVRPSAAG